MLSKLIYLTSSLALVNLIIVIIVSFLLFIFLRRISIIHWSITGCNFNIPCHEKKDKEKKSLLACVIIEFK